MHLWPAVTQQARTNPALRYALSAVSTCSSDHKTVSHNTNSHTLPDQRRTSSSTQVLSQKNSTSTAARALSGHPASPMACRLQSWLTASAWLVRKRCSISPQTLNFTLLLSPICLPLLKGFVLILNHTYLWLIIIPLLTSPFHLCWLLIIPQYSYWRKKSNYSFSEKVFLHYARESWKICILSSSSQNLRIRCNPKILYIFSLSFASLLITMQSPARIYFYSWSHPAEILIHIWCFRMSFNFQDFSSNISLKRYIWL